jgi:hypothetical protein
MKKKTCGSVQMVQVKDDEGNAEVFLSQEEIHEAIWSNIHQKWFYLAEEAPICNGPLQEVFGYNADTIAGEEVLDRLYWYGPNFNE